MSAKPTDYTKLSRQLDDLLLKLQNDQTTIEESLVLYETGTKIIDQLNDYLNTAINRLSQINKKTKTS